MQAQTLANYASDLSPVRDKDIDRDRFGRHIVGLLTTAVIFMIPIAVAGYWDTLVGGSGIIGSVLGFCVGTAIASTVIPSKILIDNEENTAYVTLNPFTGKMVAYGPGWHVSYPWEQRNADGTMSLELVSSEILLTVPTMTSEVKLTGIHQYSRSLRYIIKAVRLDSDQVEKDLLKLIIGRISEWASQMPDAMAAVNDVPNLNARLAQIFVDPPADFKAGFDYRYGIENALVAITSATLHDDLQRTRDAVEEAKTLFAVVAGLYGLTPDKLDKKLDSGAIKPEQYREMLNRAMAVSKNDTKMNIHVIEGQAPKGTNLLLGAQGGAK